MMRRLFFTSLICTLAAVSHPPAEAAIPELINYQGILKSSKGQIMPDSIYSVTFRLYDSPAEGTMLWEETQDISTANGLFNVLFGSVNSITEGVFAGDAYLSIQIDPNPEAATRVRVTAVGYAFQAGNSDKLDGYDAAQLMTAPPGAEPFCEYAVIPQFTPSFILLPGPLRHITSVYVSITSGENQVTLEVDGAVKIALHASAARADAVWSAGEGAPILVPPGSNVVLQTGAGGTCRVTVTGWSY